MCENKSILIFYSTMLVEPTKLTTIANNVNIDVIIPFNGKKLTPMTTKFGEIKKLKIDEAVYTMQEADVEYMKENCPVTDSLCKALAKLGNYLGFKLSDKLKPKVISYVEEKLKKKINDKVMGKTLMEIKNQNRLP